MNFDDVQFRDQLPLFSTEIHFVWCFEFIQDFTDQWKLDTANTPI